jgi:hypothetical protein
VLENDLLEAIIGLPTDMFYNTGHQPVSPIFRNEEFGYRTITVERPIRDEKGAVVRATKGKSKGKPEADSELREEIHAYFKREVLPHVPDARIDEEKTKVGYEIPFNRHFYVFKPPRPLSEIDAGGWHNCCATNLCARRFSATNSVDRFLHAI